MRYESRTSFLGDFDISELTRFRGLPLRLMGLRWRCSRSTLRLCVFAFLLHVVRRGCTPFRAGPWDECGKGGMWGWDLEGWGVMKDGME